MFNRSSVRREQFEELIIVTECVVLAFRPLNEERRLSRYFAVSAPPLKYNVLIDYCKNEINN
jgi:hypothetical protein